MGLVTIGSFVLTALESFFVKSDRILSLSILFSLCVCCPLVTFAAPVSSGLPTGNAARGQALYATCAACHGARGEGQAMMHAPPLVGQHSWYLNTQLLNFQRGARGTHPKDVYGAQMRAMSMVAAQPQARADILAYLATLPPLTVAQRRANEGSQGVRGDATRGQSLYTTCVACHGADGAGQEVLNSPSLRGLPSWYLLIQLLHFKGRIRGAHPQDAYGAQMMPMASTLVDMRAMKDVIAYILSL